jgi:hypothetical protein
MISDFFEFLFCPIHGVLRPDNLVALLAVWNNLSANVMLCLNKLGVL